MNSDQIKKDLAAYFKKSLRYLFLALLLLLGCNFYFFLLPWEKNYTYLIYFDILSAMIILIFIVPDFLKCHKLQEEKRRLLQSEGLICQEPELEKLDDSEIIRHDIQILQKQLQEQFEQNCDLQDYIARWCHEVKIPLSACLLINEKNQNTQVRSGMKEQLERINQLLNSALLSCKLQSSLLDIQIRPVDLSETVRTSIRNNQFFLIQKHFRLDIRIDPVTVYSDREWIVYVLDQLISNSVKYAGDSTEPVLTIRSHRRGSSVIFSLEDNGEGIKDCDLRRIFEKGFIGSNRHNGEHKSTGMGLYMVSLILEKLGHSIQAESEYGRYTRFSITFQDNRDFFNLKL